MTFDPSAVGSTSETKTVSWTARDCMLYALGVGAGVDDLAYTTNNTDGIEQHMLPTMPVTLGSDFSVLRRAGRLDWTKVLHAEQEIELFAPLPIDGQAEVTSRLAQMWDKQTAALVAIDTEAKNLGGEPLWRSRATLFIKGAGGWGGERGPSTTKPELPDLSTQPDRTISYQTRPEQALIYRLSGDYNPLHSDPAFAARAGVGRPILHGLATFGFAARAVLAFTGKEPKSLRNLSARFAAPVWPGDALHVDLWKTDGDVVRFNVRGPGGTAVLVNGRAELNTTGS
ncbi:MaoC/PaaZ C-terminal domain-containing protein [Rhodococcus aetherivorans]